LLSAFTIAGIANFGDFKTEVVMTYENLAYMEEWDEIIKKAEKEPPDDPVSMAALNLALAKRRALSEKMFHFDQGANTLFIGYERRGMTPFITGEPYYQLGLYNFAQMFAMETIESTPDVKYPVRSFKRMAETFIINRQYDIAQKYLQPLSRTLFYRRWANECISLLNDEERINSHPYWGEMRKLRSKYDFYYNYDQLDLALRYLLVSNPGNNTAYEYLMAYYLLNKDFDHFLAGISIARESGYNELPLAWQEAAAYIATRLPQLPPQLAGFTIRDDVKNNIRSYAQLFSAEKQDTTRIKKEFGKTYWYYLHFRE